METIKFKPLFLVYVFLCIYFGWYNNIFFYITAVVLHEYGHLVVAKLLGYNTSGIVFDLYGAGLKCDNYFQRKHDIIISLAGPCVNLIIILVTISCWWFFPSSYSYTRDLVECNFFVMIFNLIPIYPLDAGRVIVALFGKRFRQKKVLKVSGILCLIVGVIFSMLFIMSLFYLLNFNMLFIGMFLMFNGIICLRSLKYLSLKYISATKLTSEVKLWRVSDFNSHNLLRYLSREYYSIFLKVDNVKYEIRYEDELFR
jgi:stage IV sporulation protein FB